MLPALLGEEGGASIKGKCQGSWALGPLPHSGSCCRGPDAEQ